MKILKEFIPGGVCRHRRVEIMEMIVADSNILRVSSDVNNPRFLPDDVRGQQMAWEMRFDDARRGRPHLVDDLVCRWNVNVLRMIRYRITN